MGKNDVPEFPYRSKDLYKVLKIIGVSRDPMQFMIRKLNDGKFTPPKVGKDGHWRFSKQQLVEIARAFSPGGEGIWHFKPEEYEE